MSTMPSDIEQFVQQEVASGRYANRDAVIAHALAVLRRDREEAVAGIEAGLDDVVAGRVQPLSDACAELRRELGVRPEE